MPFRPPARAAGAVVALAFLLGSAAAAEGGLVRRSRGAVEVEAAVPLARGIPDPFFALLVGLVEGDVYGRLSRAELDSVITARGGSKLPHERLRFVERIPGEGPVDARLVLQLDGPLKVPIPYSILGYNPGSMRASDRLEVLQWRMGSLLLERGPEEEEGPPRRLRDVHLFALDHGHLEMDIDGWLDRLLAGKLDDVGITGVLLFTLDGSRYGLAFGYTPKGKGRTGVFDLSADEALFPADRWLLRLGRRMRDRTERALERGRRP